MKKLVAIVLTMCMVLVLFAGCSDSSSDNSSDVVNGNVSSVNGDNNTSDNNYTVCDKESWEAFNKIKTTLLHF
mgnify:CR=1 FL=1